MTSLKEIREEYTTLTSDNAKMALLHVKGIRCNIDACERNNTFPLDVRARYAHILSMASHGQLTPEQILEMTE